MKKQMISQSGVIGKKLIVFFIILFTIYVTILCILETDYPSGYELLFLLPVSFFLSLLLILIKLNNVEIFKNIPIVLVIGLTFVRNVLTPYSMITGSYNSSLGIASEFTAKKSILLVSYETIFIFVFLYIVEHFRFKQKGIQFTVGKKNKHIFVAILVLMLVIASIAIFFVPSLRSHYFSFFRPGYMAVATEDYSYRGNAIYRALGTAGDMSIAALRYFVPCMLFYKIAQKRDDAFSVIISLSIVFLQLFFITDSNAYIFMLMISQLIFIVKIHPRYKNALTILLCVIIFLMGLIIYINRFSLNHYSKSLSLFLQSYVPGIANTAGVLNISPQHNPFQIFADFWFAIPFKSFFGYSGNIQSLAQIWKETNNSYGQIMSTVGQSYFYFGFIFAPVLSCFLIQISRKCNKRYIEIDNAMLSATYIYFLIYSACTPFVYNFCIYMQAFLQRTVFIFLLAYFSPYDYSDLTQLSKGVLSDESNQ